MLYLLDTDICSYLIRGESEKLLENLNCHSEDTIAVSSITFAELLFGANRVNSEKIRNKINAILQKVTVIDFDMEAATKYAEIRVDLEKSGTPIGNMDMLIAACALAAKGILVTNNEKHFGYIKKLKIENWTK